MKKHYLSGVISAGVLVLALNAGAVEPTPTHDAGIRDAVKRQIEPIHTQVKDIRKEVRTEVKRNQEDARHNIEEAKREAGSNIHAAKESFRAQKEELDQRREEFKEIIKNEREALANRIKEKREELKERLDKIKDERKKDIVERIDQSMDGLNDRMVKHFNQVLDKMEDILGRIGERADRATERGQDVSAVRSAMDEAIVAISSAREAIRVQAGKTYTINITDEATLRNKVGEARQLLHRDLSAVRDEVKAVHDAIRKAATAFEHLAKPSPSPEPEITPAQ